MSGSGVRLGHECSTRTSTCSTVAHYVLVIILLLQSFICRKDTTGVRFSVVVGLKAEFADVDSSKLRSLQQKQVAIDLEAGAGTTHQRHPDSNSGMYDPSKKSINNTKRGYHQEHVGMFGPVLLEYKWKNDSQYKSIRIPGTLRQFILLHG